MKRIVTLEPNEEYIDNKWLDHEINDITRTYKKVWGLVTVPDTAQEMQEISDDSIAYEPIIYTAVHLPNIVYPLTATFRGLNSQTINPNKLWVTGDLGLASSIESVDYYSSEFGDSYSYDGILNRVLPIVKRNNELYYLVSFDKILAHEGNTERPKIYYEGLVEDF